MQPSYKIKTSLILATLIFHIGYCQDFTYTGDSSGDSSLINGYIDPSALNTNVDDTVLTNNLN
jgi:hypothetical protein